MVHRLNLERISRFDVLRALPLQVRTPFSSLTNHARTNVSLHTPKQKNSVTVTSYALVCTPDSLMTSVKTRMVVVAEVGLEAFRYHQSDRYVTVFSL